MVDVCTVPLGIFRVIALLACDRDHACIFGMGIIILFKHSLNLI